MAPPEPSNPATASPEYSNKTEAQEELNSNLLKDNRGI
jgi:hypothetical protein